MQAIYTQYSSFMDICKYKAFAMKHSFLPFKLRKASVMVLL